MNTTMSDLYRTAYRPRNDVFTQIEAEMSRYVIKPVSDTCKWDTVWCNRLDVLPDVTAAIGAATVMRLGIKHV